MGESFEMLHTFELKLKTNFSMIKALEEVFGNDLITKLSSNRYYCISNPIEIPGIRRLNISDPGKGIYYITLEIEPEVLLRGMLTVALFDCSQHNVRKLTDALNETILSIHEALPELSCGWNLSRVDYAMQIHSTYTDVYVSLANKAKIPHHYEDKINKSGSMYRQSKSVRFNFYDKYDYMKKQNVSDTLIESSRGIYRIEVQYRTTRALRHIRKKYEASAMFDLFDPDIAFDIIRNAYNKNIGMENYYKFCLAENIIFSSNLTNSMKSKIISLLKLIECAGTYEQAIEAISNNNSFVPSNYKQNVQLFKIHERILRKIGINPILLPDAFELDFLSNPFNEIMTEYPHV